MLPPSFDRKISWRNPSTNKLQKQYDFESQKDIQSKIVKGDKGFQLNKTQSMNSRKEKLLQFAELLEKRADEIALIMAKEMGKPIQQGYLEASRCTLGVKYYADNIEKLLAIREVKTEASHSFFVPQAIGVIHIIVPFNWPVVLSLRGIIPNITLGNSVIVRFADSTPETGIFMEKLFVDAGFVNHEVQTILSSPHDLDYILSQKEIKGVVFTGSTKTGKIIAQTAGKNLKKAVVELGGSDAVIVLEDADVAKAVEITMLSRMRNAGQTCIAGKRFIVHEKHYSKYIELLKSKLESQKIGDPLKKETEVGPLSRSDIFQTVCSQVQQSVQQGGKIVYGGKPFEFKVEGDKEETKGQGFFYYPTLVEVAPGNILFREEVFGPVFPVTSFQDEEEAIRIANDSEFGLGAVIISNNKENAEKIALQIEAGMVFINSPVRSDPRLPFGGTQNSGIGRSYHEIGFFEFANVQTVYNN